MKSTGSGFPRFVIRERKWYTPARNLIRDYKRAPRRMDASYPHKYFYHIRWRLYSLLRIKECGRGEKMIDGDNTRGVWCWLDQKPLSLSLSLWLWYQLYRSPFFGLFAVGSSYVRDLANSILFFLSLVSCFFFLLFRNKYRLFI